MAAKQSLDPNPHSGFSINLIDSPPAHHSNNPVACLSGVDECVNVRERVGAYVGVCERV